MPRPRAAIAMVALGATTLAITGQVAAWALGLSVAAITAATLLQERPMAWQKSGALLNGGLCAALAAGLAMFVRGELAMIALAHFAVLAQGLQLLDARPRRSEFLLVALALFQVVLAANLTDSAFFPVLLVAFTIATVWTLVVHTLRAEAIEAGQPEAASHALSAGLRRTITWASIASVLVALVLFPLLPRIRSGLLLSASAGRAVAMSGFSDRVELGDLGRIRLDPQIVLRVETLDGESPAAAGRYVRGLAFDQFDGRRWSVTPPGRSRVPGDSEIGVDLGGSRRGSRLVQRIARERIDSGVIFAAGEPSGVRGPLGRLERDAGGGLYSHRTAGSRVDYTIASRVNEPGQAALEADRAVLPAEAGERFLTLPALSPSLALLSRKITAGETSDFGRARAIEQFLRHEGRYTDRPPRLDPHNDRSPVEVFLEGELAGHCEYFASAMAMLARSAELPTRLVNGFAGGTENGLGGFIEYAQSDAHTWVEVHFEKQGWIRFDPTPPDLRLAGAAALRGAGRLAELAGALELWWFRNVVDFDRNQQARAVHRLWTRWREWRGGPSPEAPDPGASRGAWQRPRVPLWGWGLLCAALGCGAVWWRRRRASGAADLPEWYREALALLASLDLVRGPATTARAFADRAAEVLSTDGARAFRALTETYLQHRFGVEPVAPPSGELERLRDSLRALA